MGTLAVLRLLALFVPVSVYALNLTTALGLGLAIDYSLFILSRYREEVRRGGHGPGRGFHGHGDSDGPCACAA